MGNRPSFRVCQETRQLQDRPASSTQKEREYGEHNTDYQQNFRKFGRKPGDAAKTKKCRNKRYDREY